MTPDPSPPVADGAITFCSYGRWMLRRQIRAFVQEIPVVRSARDPEAVHRMRVSSRRIRSALPVFSGCFGKSRVKQWRKSFRAVTRALGEARDLDVQIGFVTEYRDRYYPGEKGQDFMGRIRYCYADIMGMSKTGPDLRTGGLFCSVKTMFRYLASPVRQERFLPVPDPAVVGPQKAGQGISCLLLRLRQKRETAQRSIEEAVEKIVESGRLEEIQQYLVDVVQGKPHDRTRVERDVYLSAFTVVLEKLHDLLVLEPFLADPAEKKRHHEFRIMVKRLRYTLEVFGPLYADRLKPYITPLKEMQDILGEIHDCDVWMDMLPRFLAEEKERIEFFFGDPSFYQEVEPDITGLLAFVTRRRDDLFAACTTRWNTLVRNNLLDRLLSTLESYAGIPVIDSGTWHETRTTRDGQAHEPVYAVFGTMKGTGGDLEAIETAARGYGVTCNLVSGCIPLIRDPERSWPERMREGPYIVVACGKNRKTVRDATSRRERDTGPGRTGTGGPRGWTRLSLADQQFLRSLPPMLRIRDNDRTIRLVGDGLLKKSRIRALLSDDAGLALLSRLFPADVIICGGMASWQTRTSGRTLVLQSGASTLVPARHAPGFCLLRLTPVAVDFIPLYHQDSPAGAEGPEQDHEESGQHIPGEDERQAIHER